MKILVDENVSYAKALFGRLGNVKTAPGRTISRETLEEAEVLIIRSVTKVNETLLNGSQIKFVGTATSGTDHVDLDWLSKVGIQFSAAPGCNAIAVVEYIFCALLWLAHRNCFVLRDKIVGIVGVGHVGGLLKKRLNAFGIHTMLCDPPQEEMGIPGEWESLEHLVAESDILTFNTPLVRSGKYMTWHLVDEPLLSALPSGRIIINTCRGEVVDNTALLRVLEKGKSLNVVLDVWESEPMISLPLLSRVDIGTAHIAGSTLEGKARGTIQIFNSYNAFIRKRAYANLETLLPPKIKHVYLSGAIDEKALRFLANLVYDIQKDDMRCRHISGLQGEFDQVRKQCSYRREWSSLCVQTDNDVNKDILNKLGFQTNPN